MNFNQWMLTICFLLPLLVQAQLLEEQYSESNPTPQETSLRIAVISDMNGDYGSAEYSIRVHKAIEHLTKIKPDAVLVTGDMVSGEKKGLDYKGMWNGFRVAVTKPLTESNIPMLVSPGNHDASGWPGFEGERKVYKEEWNNYFTNYLTKNQKVKLISTENYPFYYSFSLKNVFFMAIDATTQIELNTKLKLWLKEQSENNLGYKHKVVFSHYPFHPIAINRENDFITDKNNAVFKMLKSNGVTLFLSGHQHAYYPAIWQDIRFVGQACLGGGPRKYIGTTKVSQYSFTMVDFQDRLLIDAYYYPKFDQPVDRKTLPSSIKTPKGGSIVRDDIALKKRGF